MPKSKKPKAGALETLTKRVNKLNINFGGLVGGLLFFCLSFTPSLLPRGYVLQGFASGLSFATGYGLGVAVIFFYHKLPKKYRLTLSPILKKIILGILAITSLLFVIAGARWQDQVRQATQADPVSSAHFIRVILISAGLSFLLIWAARGARHLGRYIGKELDKFVPTKVAEIGGGVLAAVILIFLVNGVLLKGAFGVINYTFGLANKGTPPGIYQPQDPAYSGSPASSIDWNTLGEKGREFVASAPKKSAVESFAAANSQQPNRLYVGLQSAPTLHDRVNLLVKELDRTQASKRQAVLIAIPTGSGGVNAKSIQSVEYLYGGDTTALAIQYSHLPSWLSFLADQDTARQTGKELTEAVYSWWNHLDPQHRPKLLMYGESLGTFGADGAFSGASDMQSRMHGVLLVGPPNANKLWTDIVANRDEGTRQVLPNYQNGEAVRFSDGTETFIEPRGKPWEANRIGLIQHGSDPVVWGGISLFWSKPDWLDEPRGSDVLPNMKWYPFVTGWQVALDLPFAFGAAPGHGHSYGNSLADSWTTILKVQLSPDKTKQLNQIIDQVKG